MAAAQALEKPHQGKFSSWRRRAWRNRCASPDRLKGNRPRLRRRTSGAPVFANGAVTGAFSRAFNDEMERQHRIEQARQRLVQEANRLVGSDDYNAWTMKGGIRWFGDPKCNLFVSDVASLANAGVPLVNGGVYPPTAAQWADPSFDIPGWEVVSTPNPGDIAAIAKSSLNATGHVGIVAGDRLTVSATTTHGVVRNDWAFRQGQSPTFRRYVGD